jgi:hypothetical protein
VFGAAAANATARTKRLADRIAMEISSEVNSTCMDARLHERRLCRRLS